MFSRVRRAWPLISRAEALERIDELAARVELLEGSRKGHCADLDRHRSEIEYMADRVRRLENRMACGDFGEGIEKIVKRHTSNIANLAADLGAARDLANAAHTRCEKLEAKRTRKPKRKRPGA